MKVRLGQVARGIANAVEAGRYFETVHPTPDPSAGAYSAVVVMTGGTAQTYTQAALQFDVVLSAPLTDFLASLDWLSEGIEAVGEALRADPRCQGSCTGVSVASWGEVYTSNLSGGDVLAVRVTLTPTYAT